MRPDVLDAGREPARRDEVRQPAVTEPSRSPLRSLASSSDEDRRAAGPGRAGRDLDTVEAVEASGERRGPRSEERTQGRDALVGTQSALRPVDARRLEVLRPFAADADTEQQPPVRQVVERARLLRHEARVAQRQQHDARTEQQALCDGGERRQRDPEVEDRVVEGEVLAGPDRVVPELLGQLRNRAEPARVRRRGR